MNWNIKATPPQKLKKQFASKVLWALAIIMIGFALAHLVRIDKLIPTISQILSPAGASWFVVLVAIAEVLALPYLLQLRVSPLMRVVSGVLVVLAPLAWTCLAIWAAGSGHSTGQFSSYISTPGSWWLIMLNLAWLGVSYWALWLSNFDKAWAHLKKKP